MELPFVGDPHPHSERIGCTAEVISHPLDMETILVILEILPVVRSTTKRAADSCVEAVTEPELFKEASVKDECVSFVWPHVADLRYHAVCIS